MNSAINFNFLNPTPKQSRLGWILLLAGVGLLAWQIIDLRTAQQAAVELQSNIAALKNRSRTTQLTQKFEVEPTPAERVEIAQARSASLQLNYPWDQVFDAIEKAQHPDVALLGVDPKSKTGQIRLTAEAKDATAMAQYIANLQRSPHLSRALLTSHQIQTQQPGTPLRFQVLAQWKEVLQGASSAMPFSTTTQLATAEKVMP